MRNRKIRRFRHRSNGRGYQSRNNNGDHIGLASNSFSNGQSRNNFKPQQSVEKLAEKYSSLGKEALSSGDKILSENYFQHADHFIRIQLKKESDKNNAQNNSEQINEDSGSDNNKEISEQNISDSVELNPSES